MQFLGFREDSTNQRRLYLVDEPLLDDDGGLLLAAYRLARVLMDAFPELVDECEAEDPDLSDSLGFNTDSFQIKGYAAYEGHAEQIRQLIAKPYNVILKDHQGDQFGRFVVQASLPFTGLDLKHIAGIPGVRASSLRYYDEDDFGLTAIRFVVELGASSPDVVGQVLKHMK